MSRHVLRHPADETHDRRRQPAGTEPLSARSPLRLRTALSGLALIAGVIAAAVFGVRGAQGAGPGAAPWVVAVICAVVSLIAAIDLCVLGRRRPYR